MSARACVILALAAFAVPHAVADELLYQYEGDVVPYEQSAGWIIANPCDGACVESLEDGHFVLSWPQLGNHTGYRYRIASTPEDAPPSLWVEWRFRSTRLMDPYLGTCDAHFSVMFRDAYDRVDMSGDAVISFEGGDSVTGLDHRQFYTVRFESIDGLTYTFSVNGRIFMDEVGGGGLEQPYIQFGGDGGCTAQPPIAVNEWDFIRFGTISYGEQIVASEPSGGFLDARQHAGLDRFTITFDEPNYVYLDEITVEVTGGVAPEVIQTHRGEHDEPDTVEIVLDRPIPFGETTSFTFDDGVAVNVVEYTFAPGDIDGDGDADLHDFAAFQTCFGRTDLTGPCSALDLHPDDTIDLTDYGLFNDLLAGS